MNVERIRLRLEALQDEKYKDFNSKLLPGTDNVLGVRIPEIRKLAKEMVKEDWRSYFDAAPNEYYEEDMLRGFLIGYGKMDLDERFERIRQFLPSIHNWAVCDSFCATLKFTKQHMNAMWEFLQPLFESEETYTIRFAVVMALNYYTLPEYAPYVFDYFNKIKNTDYYVQMGIAWAVSIFYIKLPEMTEQYLKKNKLNDFTHNKAIQKICESYRVDSQVKQKLRELRRG